MRDIKFRALRDDVSNCNFYYGSLTYDKEGNPRIQHYSTDLFHTCIKGTVGQFTGLQDKNGVDIYEGDIYTAGAKNIKYKVIFREGCFIGNQIGNRSLAGLSHFIKIIEVIGNIHQN